MISNVLTILLESISFWICLHIVFKKKIKFSAWDFVFFSFYCIYFMIWTYNNNFRIFFPLFICSVFLYMNFKFKEKEIQLLLGIIYAFSICAIMQLISGFVVTKICSSYYDAEYFKVYIGILSCLLSILIYYKFSLQNIIKIIKYNKNILLFCVACVVFFIYLKIDIENSNVLDITFYMFLFITILIAFKGIIKEQKYFFELEKKNYEIKMNEIYNQKYIDLIHKIRIRQHDYNNQLAVIQSMYMSATSLEELVERQKAYINVIENKKDYDFILLSCNSPILSGYLYSLCLEYEKEKIKFTPNVKIYSIGNMCSVHKITEILGVLLKNAQEYISINEVRNEINLDIMQNDKEFQIEVSNPSKYISYIQIENMFKMGYSTKGEDRGIGLYSIKNIVEELNGFIIAENKLINDENWFFIKVIISFDK